MPEMRQSIDRCLLEQAIFFLSLPTDGLVHISPVEQVSPDEGIEVAIEDFLHIATLDLGSVVLDKLVGLQRVGTDLAAETNVGFRGIELASFLLALFELELVESRTENFHGQLAILVLAALVLALHDDAGRQVCDADGGFDFVHVLAAMSAGAKCVYAQLLGLHHDVDLVIDFGDGEDRRERSVASRRLVEWGNAHKAMNSTFAREHTESVLALDLHGGGFDAGFFAGSRIEDGGPEPFLLGPAEIHAQQHLGPVL